MSNPDFSVVIPLYNKGPHIARAVRSVLAQSCPNFELIVIDDGSTDGGGEIVEAIQDPRIILIRQENSGVSAARNRGVEYAKADLVAFLDADDEWKPSFLDTISRLRQLYPHAGIYATAYEIVQPDGRKRVPRLREIPKKSSDGILPSYFRSAALGEPPVCASAVCIPKKLICDAGLFQVGKRMGEDIDLWGKIALDYNVAFSRNIEAIYYQDSVNRACTKFGKDDEHPFIDTASINIYSKKLSADNKNNILLYVARLKLLNARQYVLIGNYQRARQLMSGTVPLRFTFKKLIWGTFVNRLTHVLWVFKASLFNYSGESYKKF